MLSLSAKAAGKRPITNLPTRQLGSSCSTFSTTTSQLNSNQPPTTTQPRSKSSTSAQQQQNQTDQQHGRLYKQLISLHRSHSAGPASWNSNSPTNSPAAIKAGHLRQQGQSGWSTTHNKKRGSGVLDRQHANQGARRTLSTSTRTQKQPKRPIRPRISPSINRRDLAAKEEGLLAGLQQMLGLDPVLSERGNTPLESGDGWPVDFATHTSKDHKPPIDVPAVDSDLAHLAKSRPWNPSLLEYSRLEPGCFVDVRRGGLPTSGIYLGPIPPQNTGVPPTRDHQILASSGAFVAVLPEDVTFVLPFAEASLARRAGVEGVQSDAARSLWQLQRRFKFAVERRTKTLVERGAKDLYSTLEPEPDLLWALLMDNKSSKGSSSTGRTRTISTGQALDLMSGQSESSIDGSEYPLMDHLIMHDILMAREDEFVADPVAHRNTGQFTVRPRSELAELEHIRRWVRQGGRQLDSFVKEATAAINFGRATKLTKSDRATIKGPAWSPTSIRLLNFLKRTATGSSRMIQLNPYLAISPAILKAVDAALNPIILDPSLSSSPLTSTDINSVKAATTSVPAGSDLDRQDMSRERILAFLAEVGAVAKWENWAAHESADLIGWDNNECSAKQLERSRPKPVKDGVLDAHDSIRHDFAKLAVYTIDDPGALELDDGISIELVAGKTSEYWIHAHIADPTTLIAPRSALADLAQQRNNTEYFPERTYAMLPHKFIQQNHLSLGSGGDEAQKTVTISTRITEDGKVLESVVRAGVVTNVKRLTYGAVDGLLGYQKRQTGPILVHPIDSATADRLTLDPPSPARQTDDGWLASDPAALADLSVLHKLATALIARRTRNDALYWHIPRASPTVTGNVTHHYKLPSAPTFYSTPPVVSLALTSPLGGADPGPAPQSTPAQLVVSEIMILANRSAARFAVEGDIPLPFVSQPQPDASEAQLAAILALRNPLTGEARGEDVLKQGIEFSRSEVGLEPKPHWPMGIKDQFGYVRVTSPLRRFGDLLGHWQLKSALLTSNSTKLAFDKSQVGQMIATMNDTTKRRGKADRHANAFWAAYLLRAKHQALVNPAAGGSGDELAEEVLTSLTAIALRAPLHSVGDGRWLQQCLIKEVGMMGQVWMGSLGEGLAVGESGGVELVKVVVGGRSRLIVKRK